MARELTGGWDDPVLESEPGISLEMPSEEARVNSAAAVAPDHDSIGILLVDDHRENLIALHAVLEPLGVRLLCAESGEQALRALLREEISVILLDVRMAGLDGVETARLIRARSRTRHIPIIFLTAQASDVAEIALAYQSGAVDYVIKPFDPDILRAKVSVFIELHRERAERVRQSQARSRAEAMARAAQTLQSLSDTALSHLEVDGLVPELLERTTKLFAADSGLVLMESDAGPGLRAVAHAGLPLPGAGAGVVVPGQDVLGRIAAEHRGALLAGRELEAALIRAPDSGGIPESGRPGGSSLAELLAVPMVTGGELAGLVLLGSHTVGHFSRADLELLTLAADRMALAILHAQRFAEGRELVETLQRSLLPESLPHHPQLEIAARYLPSGLSQRIGGDWYDALEIDGDRTAVMIGDIVGHGTRAATKMSELRNALRAYAAEGHGPVEALALLDRLVQRTVGPQMIGTALFLLIDVRERTLTIARAGHPPPAIRRRGGEVKFLEAESVLPVGIETDVPTVAAVHPIAPGETVLLYTDGLVERRRESISVGLGRLHDALQSAPLDAEALCDHVLARMVGHDESTSDDIALVALKLLPARCEPLELTLDAEPPSVPAARHRLRRWLEANAPELNEIRRSDIELLISEASSNVVRHAYRELGGRFTATASIEGGAIVLAVSDSGSWREPPAGHGGHGLPLMRELSDELVVDSGADGSTVTMRFRLSLDPS
jgi:serine phosphatase RsbU (regulator of sigma subunit)/DNA-binding response OmpR family regulator/anti-sigma regulatory factor (Ser/Thr protein kinase)